MDHLNTPSTQTAQTRKSGTSLASTCALLVLTAAMAGCVVAPVHDHGRYEPRGGGAVIVQPPPPPPRVEQPGPPVSGYVWIQGYWSWGGGRYVWVPGRWEQTRPGHRWEHHRWERDHDGRWMERGGQWQRD